MRRAILWLLRQVVLPSPAPPPPPVEEMSDEEKAALAAEIERRLEVLHLFERVKGRRP